MDTVELKLCIVTTLTRRGKGTFEPDSPIRIVTEVWDTQTGKKIAENDPCAPKYSLCDGTFGEAKCQ